MAILRRDSYSTRSGSAKVGNWSFDLSAFITDCIEELQVGDRIGADDIQYMFESQGGKKDIRSLIGVVFSARSFAPNNKSREILINNRDGTYTRK